MSTEGELPQMNFAVVGNADGAKTTLISVLSTGVLDDGNGSARGTSIMLQHERESGRTSSIKMVRLTDQLGLIDLAGQEVYLRLTIEGLTRYYPKAALLVVAANRGITQIDEAHFRVCVVLRIPVIVVITKVDLCPPDRLKETLREVENVCKRRTKHAQTDDSHDKFHLYKVNKEGPELENTFQQFTDPDKLHKIYPLFQVSNKTGQGIDLLKSFLLRLAKEGTSLVQPNPAFDSFLAEQGIRKVFRLYRSYYVEGIGWVMHGDNGGAPISVGDRLLLGPYNSQFLEVRIRSIHTEARVSVRTLPARTSGCIALKPTDGKLKLHRKLFVGGKVVIDKPVVYSQIRLKVRVCGFQVTVEPGYSPYMHCAHVGVNVKILEVRKLVEGELVEAPMKHGDTGVIIVHLATKQFIVKESTVILRDGGVKLYGIVSDVSAEGWISYDDKKWRPVRNQQPVLPIDESRIVSDAATHPYADYVRSLQRGGPTTPSPSLPSTQ